jgi:hypothetical protein
MGLYGFAMTGQRVSGGLFTDAESKRYTGQRDDVWHKMIGEAMFCKECGSEVAPSNKFCARCGAPVPSMSSAGLVSAPRADEPVSVPTGEPTFVPADAPASSAPTGIPVAPFPSAYSPAPTPPYSSAAVPRPAPGTERTFGIVLMAVAALGVLLGLIFPTFVQRMYYAGNLPYALISFISAVGTALVPLILAVLGFIGMGFAARLKRQGLPSAWFSGAATADIIAGLTLVLVPFVGVLLGILTSFVGFSYAITNGIQFALTLIGGGAATVLHFLSSSKARELAGTNAGMNIISGLLMAAIVLYTLFRLFIQPQLISFLAYDLGMATTSYSFILSAFGFVGSLCTAAFFVVRGLFWMRASTKTQPK